MKNWIAEIEATLEIKMAWTEYDQSLGSKPFMRVQHCVW